MRDDVIRKLLSVWALLSAAALAIWVGVTFDARTLAQEAPVAVAEKPAAPEPKSLTELQHAQQTVLELSQTITARDDRIGELEMEVGVLRRQLSKLQKDRLTPLVQQFVTEAAKTLGGQPGDYDPTTRQLKPKPVK